MHMHARPSDKGLITPTYDKEITIRSKATKSSSQGGGFRRRVENTDMHMHARPSDKELIIPTYDKEIKTEICRYKLNLIDID